MVGGLPGSGKSTLAKCLGEQGGFSVIRSDVVRKELAGLASDRPSPTDARPELYSPEWNERTYAECLRQAESLLFEGKRVLVDATFREEQQRLEFLHAAVRWGVPAVLLLTRAEPETIHQRLASRKGDASDADWETYLQAAALWEEPSSLTRPFVREINCEGSVELTRQHALNVLREFELWGLPVE